MIPTIPIITTTVMATIIRITITMEMITATIMVITITRITTTIIPTPIPMRMTMRTITTAMIMAIITRTPMHTTTIMPIPITTLPVMRRPPMAIMPMPIMITAIATHLLKPGTRSRFHFPKSWKNCFPTGASTMITMWRITGNGLMMPVKTARPLLRTP